MFVAIWSPEGEDEGYLNIDTLDRFKLETEGGSSVSYNLVAKKGVETKVWKISGNSYVNIIKSMGRHSF